MLADVDRAVAALLESERLGGQAAKVAFDAPKKEWAAARTAPTLNLFLADIREDLTRRTTTLIEELPGRHARRTITNFSASRSTRLFNTTTFPSDSVLVNLPRCSSKATTST